ncbi:MAG: tyrosine-type recombinase/integrase [Lachnospiraceae bacterium]|nr:tyrosine-type recombinase/integrase [Lachnospiraceae bacterium]
MRRKEILEKHKSPVRQLPNGRWYTRVNGKKIDKKDKKDLEDAIVSTYLERDICIASIFRQYLERRKVTVSDSTWSKDLTYYRLYIKGSFIENKPLKDLDCDDGYRFLMESMKRKPDMKERYWHNLYGFMNQIFQFAMEKRYIDENPFKHMRPNKDLFAPVEKPRDEDTVFSPTEQARITAMALEEANKKQSGLPLTIIILFNIGTRNGELCALKWGDIETQISRHGNAISYIHVQRELVANFSSEGKVDGFRVLPHTKSNAGDRRILLNTEALETLHLVKSLNAANGFPTGLDDFIFLRKGKNGIEPITPRCYDPLVRRYCKRLGMDTIKSPHDIRRSWVTNLHRNNMPLKLIQNQAGHSTMQMTMSYIRFGNEDEDLIQEYMESVSSKPLDVINFEDMKPKRRSRGL